MKKLENNLKKNVTNINEKGINNPNSTLKERIKGLIKKNEEIIKRYEKIKENTKNSQKKMEYLKIISKFRTRQISLNNKLHGLDLIMNSYSNNYQNNIINTKAKIDNMNKIIKNTFHKRINSFEYNYSAIFTNSNSNQLKNKSDKKNSNSKLNNTSSSKLIPKPTKISYLLPIKKKEIKKPKNNNKNFISYINASGCLRINTNTNDYINNSMVNKNSDRQNNNYYIKTNNKVDNSKNIIIINNINNFFGKIENSNINNIKMSEHIINNRLRQKIKDKIMEYNLIEEDEQSDLDIDDESVEILKQIEFKSNPNLLFRKKVLDIKKNVVIEIFNSFTNNNKIYMAISEKSFLGHNIKIFRLKNKKFITRLKRHKHKIICLKYFFNPIKKHDYLISGDTGFFINIWDISHKYLENQFLNSIKYQGQKLFSLLPVFIRQKESNTNYLLIYDTSITIYDLKNGNYLKTINHSRLLDDNIINLIIWKNKNNFFDYIIKCSELKITIFNFIDSEIFFTLSDYTNNEDKNKYVTEGCIIPGDKNDYLCIMSYSSYLLNIYLEIWDLYELSLKQKIIINRMLINDAYLLNIIPWNYKYILFSDGNKNYLYVINLEANKIVSKICTKYTNDINHIYFKKVISEEYGESLIVWKHNNFISLFSINGKSP